MIPVISKDIYTGFISYVALSRLETTGHILYLSDYNSHLPHPMPAPSELQMQTVQRVSKLMPLFQIRLSGA